jgi:hypothetical protein
VLSASVFVSSLLSVVSPKLLCFIIVSSILLPSFLSFGSSTIFSILRSLLLCCEVFIFFTLLGTYLLVFSPLLF